MLRLVNQCRQAGIAVSFVPQDYELFITRSVLRKAGGIPLVAIDGRTASARALCLRRLCDGTVAALALVMTAPVSLSITLALLALGRQPIVGVARCGMGNRPFKLYNFNTRSGVSPATWLDRLLDFVMLPHLPELWNVLSGDMCLVGPRPESAHPLPHYTKWQKLRFDLVPGITGYGQIYGLQGERTAAEIIKHDIRYVAGWSPLLDFAMIIQTVWCIFRRSVVAIRNAIISRVCSPHPGISTEVQGADSSQPGSN